MNTFTCGLLQDHEYLYVWTSSSYHVKENHTKAISVNCHRQSFGSEEIFGQIPLRPMNGAEKGVLGLVQFSINLPGDTEVTNFGKKILVEQNICGLDVPVDEGF